MFERGDLVFVFNFHPHKSYSRYVSTCELVTDVWVLCVSYSNRSVLRSYKVGCDLPGKYRVALDSDAREFGGQGRVSVGCHSFEFVDLGNFKISFLAHSTTIWTRAGRPQSGSLHFAWRGSWKARNKLQQPTLVFYDSIPLKNLSGWRWDLKC